MFWGTGRNEESKKEKFFESYIGREDLRFKLLIIKFNRNN